MTTAGPSSRTEPPARSAATVRARAASVGRLLLVPVRRLTHLWRRSIQARVVIGTLTLSALLAVLAGWVLMRQVTDGLLDGKRQAALTQAAAGVDTAQSKLDGAEVTDQFDVGPVLSGLAEVLAPRDEARDDYAVVVIGPLDTVDPQDIGEAASRGPVDLDTQRSIPPALMSTVQTTPGTWWAYSTVDFTDQGDGEQPGMVVGAQIRIPGTGENYGLFYVYSLREQQDTLFVVRRALVTAGSILVVLLGIIAWLVTRQVVTPVRFARRIAERLASGRLEERMLVRGEDDIARLGISFNKMAGSLQRQIRQLEELSRVQRRFVADVSHELRTPLTTVRMAADLLHERRDEFDPATKRSAELLQHELNRFEGLLDDLLEISRFDAGAAALDLADTDLRELARSVVETTRALATKNGSVVTLNLPPTPCVVEADARRVERIVRNLVVNAIEYGAGRPVEVTVAASTDAVALTVRDHGIGLRAGEENLVFNRFWRADPARARTHGGTGLGLSIAVEDSALHGGVLDAVGRPGKGSQFRLTLPRRVGAAPGPSPLPREPRWVADRAGARVSDGGPRGRVPS